MRLLIIYTILSYPFHICYVVYTIFQLQAKMYFLPLLLSLFITRTLTDQEESKSYKDWKDKPIEKYNDEDFEMLYEEWEK